MKLIFFHISDNRRIEKFDSSNHGNEPNFFWVDDRYHTHTPPYNKSPGRFIHIFIADPWKEGYTFTFMQDIGNNNQKLTEYYVNEYLTHRYPGTAPILRIADAITPTIIGEHTNNGTYLFGNNKISLIDGETPIPFLNTKLIELLPQLKSCFPIKLTR